MNTQAISRQHFLHGKTAVNSIIRPPWSIDEQLFTDKCTQCFECARACPSHLIVKGTGGYPEVSFKRHGCDYCEACVRACPESVLQITPENQTYAWSQIADIGDECFIRRGVVCRSCGEICETRAITFKPVPGGLSQINLNIASCNGCGECVHVCPAHAIEIKKIR